MVMGYLIGAFVENQLIAFRAVVVPEIDEEHLGYDLGLVEEVGFKTYYVSGSFKCSSTLSWIWLTKNISKSHYESNR